MTASRYAFPSLIAIKPPFGQASYVSNDIHCQIAVHAVVYLCAPCEENSFSTPSPKNISYRSLTILYLFLTAMPTSTGFDRSQAAHLPSVAPIIAQSGREYTNSNVSNSATSIDSYDKELEVTRRTVTGFSIDHPEWPNASRALASSLFKRFQETSRATLLTECIHIQREICAVSTTGHPDRAVSVSYLASSLRTYFKQTHEESPLAEAIDLNR
jgi:hypothetical protein